MTSVAPYSPDETALLLVDPYNDFLSEGGKLWPRAKEVAEGVGLLDHMRTMLATARSQGFRVFIVPHHQTTPNDYITWDHLSPTQQRIVTQQTFAEGSWGAEWSPDLRPRRASWSCASTGLRAASLRRRARTARHRARSGGRRSHHGSVTASRMPPADPTCSGRGHPHVRRMPR
ncbi:cysteine hydrolase family protein [Streptomyces sp. NPDC020845]|uniref:cysteine hydrolase family protein n=1 Tax=Streptomyces sp. NPDC020845 TaxID=3365096 RepID=UPI00378E4B2E